MPTRIIVRAALIATVLALAACQDMDPYTRPGTWQPTGSNAGNIAAQVANPYDLIRGRELGRPDSAQAVIAIGHVTADKPKALPHVDSQTGGGGGGGGGQPPGGS